MSDPARVILGLATEQFDEGFIWSRLENIQTGMFSAGAVAIKFAYFGSEGTEGVRPFIGADWVSSADDMADVMRRARARCECGCFVDVGDILEAALAETRRGPVQAVIIIADNFHGNMDQAIDRAQQLRAAGTRIFVFQRGTHPDHGKSIFRTLAEQTGGALFSYNPAVERIAERLPVLLEAVTHYAVSGIEAPGAQPLLLERLK
jgi:hypothetical protein